MIKTEWWRGALIYEVYPRSFLDTNGDGIGDLQGITSRLDYIASLGVDALWLAPIFKSPMRDFGYDVSDYRQIEPLFGRNEDFYELIQLAHEKGLRVITDLVLGHTSDQHPWFQASRREKEMADWYVWAEAKPDGTPPNNWLSVFGGSAWQWDTIRNQYYLHHYLRTQPNLNWHIPEVVEAMLGELRFWLDHGVDGLRLDAITTLVHDEKLRDNPVRVPPPDKAFADGNNPLTRQQLLYTRDLPQMMDILARIRALLNEYPERYSLGEVADVDMIEVSAKYTQTGHHLHSCYNFELMRTSVDAEILRDIVLRTEAALGAGWTTWAMSNHDSIRVITRYGSAPNLQGNPPVLARMLLALLTTLRGGACIYEGEELGLTEAQLSFDQLQDPYGIEFWPEFQGRDGCRTPMPWKAEASNLGFTTGKPWLPLPAEHRPLAISVQATDPESTLNRFRECTKFRRQHPALITGSLKMLPTSGSVLAFVRQQDDDEIACVFNLSNIEAEAHLAGTWTPITTPSFPSWLESSTVRLPPFGFGFFEAKPLPGADSAREVGLEMERGQGLTRRDQDLRTLR
jgi:alpha-glucosidase